MSLLSDIQNWFKINCNGDWEHEYGVHISTIDNPGWCLKVDLTNTALDGTFFSKKKNNNPEDWYTVKTENNEFIAYGDPNKLEELVEIFLSYLRSELKKSKLTYTLYISLGKYEDIEVWRPIEGRMVDINEFEIESCPVFDIQDLKVRNIEDLDKISFDQVKDITVVKEGDLVTCKLINFFDYPALIIDNKCSRNSK